MNWLLGLCFAHFQHTPSFKSYISILCTFRILFYWIITLDLTTLRIIFHWIFTLVSCATSGFFFNRYLRWYLGNLKDFLSEIVTVESRAFSASPSFQSYAIALRSFRVFLDWIAILRYLTHFKPFLTILIWYLKNFKSLSFDCYLSISCTLRLLFQSIATRVSWTLSGLFHFGL